MEHVFPTTSSLQAAQKTKSTLLATYLLTEPLISLFNVLAVFLAKDLGATPLQISVFTMLKPTVSLFSFYWSSLVCQRKQKLLTNLVGANVLSVIPFLFLILYDNTWYIIFATAIYMLFSRAGMPAFMEILKVNLSKQERERAFSLASTWAYIEGFFLAFIIGKSLDIVASSWKCLFFISSALVLIAAYLQSKIPLPEHKTSLPPETNEHTTSFIFKVIKPFQDSVSLMKKRADFAHFQKGFMIAMFGLMFAMPAIPFFLSDQNLSFTELMISFNICKGLGFILAAPIWTRKMRILSINQFSTLVCIGFGVFYFFLLLAPFNFLWLFWAYLIYGIVQAGSNLLWHMSGSLFADHEDSTPYSAVNVLFVGVRGIIVPPLGGLFCQIAGAPAALIVGLLACLWGGWYLTAKQPVDN